MRIICQNCSYEDTCFDSFRDQSLRRYWAFYNEFLEKPVTERQRKTADLLDLPCGIMTFLKAEVGNLPEPFLSEEGQIDSGSQGNQSLVCTDV